MSQVLVWRSDADSKLFEDKAKYQAHLRKLARERLLAKKVAAMQAEREVFLTQMGQVASIHELNVFIKDNWKWFWTNGLNNELWRYNKSKPEFHEYVDVSLVNMHWSATVSNSHSRPRAGVENFNTRADYNKGKPTSYPGWIGRININVRPPMYRYKRQDYMKDGWGSSYFTNTLINTGSGGGGGGDSCKSYSYDVRLFAADFPVMWEEHMKQAWIDNENNKRQREWRYLGGKSPITPVTSVPADWTPPNPLETPLYG